MNQSQAQSKPISILKKGGANPLFDLEPNKPNGISLSWSKLTNSIDGDSFMNIFLKKKTTVSNDRFKEHNKKDWNSPSSFDTSSECCDSVGVSPIKAYTLLGLSPPKSNNSTPLNIPRTWSPPESWVSPEFPPAKSNTSTAFNIPRTWSPPKAWASPASTPSKLCTSAEFSAQKPPTPSKFSHQKTWSPPKSWASPAYSPLKTNILPSLSPPKTKTLLSFSPPKTWSPPKSWVSPLRSQASIEGLATTSTTSLAQHNNNHKPKQTIEKVFSNDVINLINFNSFDEVLENGFNIPNSRNDSTIETVRFSLTPKKLNNI